jgi:hypothetical protein
MESNLNHTLDMPLVIKAAGIEKVASYTLSENIDGWDKEIIKIVHEDIPYVTNYNYEIEFKKLDKKYGYAVGSVKFNQIKNVYIPLIIRKYQLSHLDIIVSGDKAMPLSEQTFEAITANKTKIGELKDPRYSQPFLERQNTQAYDEVSYPISKYGMLGLANGEVNLKKIANKNPNHLVHYRNNNTLEILKQALKAPAKPPVKADEQEKAEAKEITNVDSSIYKSVDKTGEYKIASLQNTLHQGLFIKSVHDFDLEKHAFSLFITDDGKYGFQEKYAGVTCPSIKIDKKKKDTSPVKEKLDAIEKDAGVGDTVSFIARKNDSCFATVPIKIASKISMDGYEKISGHTIIGEPVDIYLTPKIRTITKTAENIYHIPTNRMEMIKIGDFQKYHWNSDVVKNQAVAKYANNTTRLVKDGAMFSLENDHIKAAGILTPTEIYEHLKDYYSNAIEMVKIAAKKQSTLFTGVKLASVKKTEPINIAPNMEGLFKIAASLTDPDSVDAVLSLGYINETNVENYVKAIPKIEDIISKLAKLLLSIRLGLKGDEYSVKQAMNQLQQTADNLKKYRK